MDHICPIEVTVLVPMHGRLQTVLASHSLRELQHALQQEWNALDQVALQGLICSTRCRCRDVIVARGLQTQY
ncbi:hypothetical protein ACOMHN_005664 [Nucella lapillus]